MAHSTGTAASGGVLEVAVAAVANGTAVIEEVHYSYAGTPTSGLLSIVERNAADDADATVLYREAVTVGGVGLIPLRRVIPAGNANRKVVVRLADGGQTKYLDVWYRYDYIPLS